MKSVNIPRELEKDVKRYIQLMVAPTKDMIAIEVSLNSLLAKTSSKKHPEFYATILFEFGTFLLETTNDSEVDKLEKAVLYLKKAKKLRKYEKASEELSLINIQLGKLYLRLSSVAINSDSYLKSAIGTLQSANQYYQGLGELKSRSKKEVMNIQNFLGDAYLKLYSKSEITYAEKAITSYEEALQVSENINSPKEKMDIQNKLADLLLELGQLGFNKKDNIKRAVDLYEQILDNNDWESKYLQFANINSNLGTSYLELDEFYPKTLQTKALKSLNKALDIYTPTKTPTQYIKTTISLARLYRMSHDEVKINKATYILERLALFAKDKSAYDLGLVQINLALTHIQYSELPNSNRLLYLGEALRLYKLALSIYTFQEYPREYATTNIALGNLYYDIGEKKHNNYLLDAFMSYLNVLQVFSRKNIYLSPPDVLDLVVKLMIVTMIHVQKFMSSPEFGQQNLQIVNEFLLKIDLLFEDGETEIVEISKFFLLFFKENLNMILKTFDVKDKLKVNITNGVDLLIHKLQTIEFNEIDLDNLQYKLADNIGWLFQSPKSEKAN